MHVFGTHYKYGIKWEPYSYGKSNYYCAFLPCVSCGEVRRIFKADYKHKIKKGSWTNVCRKCSNRVRGKNVIGERKIRDQSQDRFDPLKLISDKEFGVNMAVLGTNMRGGSGGI